MIIWEFHIRKGTWEKKVVYLFQYENINDIVFEDMKIPERDENDTSAGDDNRKSRSS